MRKIKTMRRTLVFVFLSLVFCVITFATGSPKAQAEPMSFDFTYTTNDSTDTVGVLGDTLTFRSRLTNTGTEADSYVVTMITKPPTPSSWVIYFCSGGVCHPPSVTQDTVFLPAGEWDSIYVDINPRFCCDDAKVTIRVTSIKSPGLTKSINFFLHVECLPECIPLTNRWGLFALIILISISGFYLIWRRLKPAKVT
jgi:hypothetical protein